MQNDRFFPLSPLYPTAHPDITDIFPQQSVQFIHVQVYVYKYRHVYI